MFKRKWYWVPAAVIVLCISGIVLFFLKPKTETQEPIKTYRVVTPAPKTRATKETGKEETGIAPSHSHDHSHGHLHETVPHVHAEETNISSSGYDWRDDSAFDATLPKSDPWKQTHPASETIDTTDDIYPPRDWYKTEDSELFIKYFRAQLIKQFGDIEEVHTIADRAEKRKKGILVSLDEQIRFLEAQYFLWPHKNTLQTLESLRKLKTNNHHGEH